MREAGIGRVLVASLHQGDCRHPADAPRVLRELAERRRAARGDDRPGAAVCGAEFSAAGRRRLPASSPCAPASTRPSGRCSRCRRCGAALIKAAPAWLRTRMLLRLVASARPHSYQGSRAISRLRRGTASIDVRASVFCIGARTGGRSRCAISMPPRSPDCWRCSTSRARAEVVACRGTGETSCVLKVRSDERTRGGRTGVGVMNARRAGARRSSLPVASARAQEPAIVPRVLVDAVRERHARGPHFLADRSGGGAADRRSQRARRRAPSRGRSGSRRSSGCRCRPRPC